jgi:hypothetical protein
LHVFQRKILAIGQVQGGDFSSLCFMDKMTSDEGKSGKPCLLSLKEILGCKLLKRIACRIWRNSGEWRNQEADGGDDL